MIIKSNTQSFLFSVTARSFELGLDYLSTEELALASQDVIDHVQAYVQDEEFDGLNEYAVTLLGGIFDHLAKIIRQCVKNHDLAPLKAIVDAWQEELCAA